MACAGIDFGSKTSVVAIARRGGIDVVCNEVSNRATPSMVSFAGAERHAGEAAANFASQNFKNTIAGLPLLLGLDAAAPMAVAEAARSDATIIPDADTGRTAVRVSYGAPPVDTELSVEALSAMFLGKLMSFASAEYGSAVKDCVVSVPGYWTQSQRHALLDAASIAGINVMRLMHEHAALALAYGMFRASALPDEKPAKVLFVDVGDASTTAFTATFTKGRADITSTAFDATLGGRSIDDVLVQHFAADFKTRFHVDALSRPRPRLRLRKDVEKLKRVLSANADGRLNIECLMDDVDVSAAMKRADLEELIAPIVDRTTQVVKQALGKSSAADLLAVELVGGGVRVPAIKAAIKAALDGADVPLQTTLNADEAVARGCALMAADLMPGLQRRPFTLNDVLPCGGARLVPTYGPDANAEAVAAVRASTVAIEAQPLGRVNRVELPYLGGPIETVLHYRKPESLPVGVLRGDETAFAKVRIEAPVEAVALDGSDAPAFADGKSASAFKPQVDANVRVNENGIISVDCARLKKLVTAEVPAPAPAADMAVDGNGAVANGDVAPANGDAKGDADKSSGLAASAAAAASRAASAVSSAASAAAAAVSGSKTDSADTAPPKVPMKSVSQVAWENLLLTPLPPLCQGGMGAAAISAAADVEASMVATDVYQRELGEARNALEAYVYDVRVRVDAGGDLAAFGTEKARTALLADLNAAEEWIYSEEGEEANKSAFVARRDALVSATSGMLQRKKEADNRLPTASQLRAMAARFRTAAGGADLDHVTGEEKDKVVREADDAERWVDERLAAQASVASDVDPVVTVDDIRRRGSAMSAVCTPIVTRPKPPPPAPPAPAKEETPKADAPAADGAAPAADAANGEAKPADAAAPTTDAPMDTDGAKVTVEEVDDAAAAAATAAGATKEPVKMEVEEPTA
eukprot:TRINITY_DN2079_c0_g1_i1.p1 TRINITY_DN2079_c0_g1~~TRINITY_DN2079_c0_g1_i1.p1  ORF type:complete len:1069 (+),score=357.60 TRINITY_DN2079_c0_g1_i1:425-3208(+)